MPRPAEHLQKIDVLTRDALWDWLAAHHTQTESVWFVKYKKRDDLPYYSMDQMIEVLLCWGWIDSLHRGLDDRRTMVLCAPRKVGSAWSAVNKAKVAHLEADGLLQPVAMEKIAKAKQDGSWDFLNDVDALIKPEDLRDALSKTPGALAGFDGPSKSAQRGTLEWIKRAKRPETREKRLLATVKAAASGKPPL